MSRVRGVDCGLNNWAKDYPFGKQGEDMARDFLVEKFGMQFIRFHDKKSHDIEMVDTATDRVLFFEIKRDRYDSGNMVVEYSGPWGPSGINVTLSDYWVNYFEDTQEYWLIPVYKLRRLLNSQRQKKNVFWRGKGGDGGKTWMYFLKREHFHQYFEIYKKIDDKFLRVYWSKPTGQKDETIYSKVVCCCEEQTYTERDPSHPFPLFAPFSEVPQFERASEIFRSIPPAKDSG